MELGLPDVYGIAATTRPVHEEVYFSINAKTLDEKLFAMTDVLKLEETPWLKNQQEKIDYLANLEFQYDLSIREDSFSHFYNS